MVLNNSLLYNMLAGKKEIFKTRMILKTIDRLDLLNLMLLQIFSHILVTETHIKEGLSAFLIFFSHSVEGSSVPIQTHICVIQGVLYCVLSHIFKEPTNVSIPHERRGCKSKHTHTPRAFQY